MREELFVNKMLALSIYPFWFEVLANRAWQKPTVVYIEDELGLFQID